MTLRGFASAFSPALPRGQRLRRRAPCVRYTATRRQPRPSILLVTLDTTRADAIGPEARGVDTPAFNALAARGRRFRQAYATAPETLPSHSSMMTGLYPGGPRRARERAATLPTRIRSLAARLKDAGYRTAAFVSSFILARRFGLARGFDVYDDTLPAGQVERAVARDDRSRRSPISASRPRSRSFSGSTTSIRIRPTRPPGTVRTLSTRRRRTSARSRRWTRSSAASSRHSTRTPRRQGGPRGHHRRRRPRRGPRRPRRAPARQPSLPVDDARAAGRGGAGHCAGGTTTTPVSTRRVFHTILDWAGHRRRRTACAAVDGPSPQEVVLGEAMKPFLGYGWQPQIMAVEGRQKAILRRQDRGLRRHRRSGGGEESRCRAPICRRRSGKRWTTIRCPRRRPRGRPRTLATRRGATSRASATSARARRRWCARTRRDRPTWWRSSTCSRRPRDSSSQEQYAQVIPLLEKILAADPYNLDADASSGDGALVARPRRAGARGVQEGRGDRAALTRRSNLPGPALRARQGLAAGRAAPRAHRRRDARAAAGGRGAGASSANVRDDSRRRSRCGRRSRALRTPTRGGPRPAGAAGDAGAADDAGDRVVRAVRARRWGRPSRTTSSWACCISPRAGSTDARDALDRVPPSHPEYPMALFKRAQVSVLLKEPDSAARIARARQHADRTTRELIARERLFQ